MTNEFQHYTGCNHKDPDNCSGCALTTGGQEGPNYSAWPIAYMENYHVIPAKWKAAFGDALNSDNEAYANNVRETAQRFGAKFSDGTRF